MRRSTRRATFGSLAVAACAHAILMWSWPLLAQAPRIHDSTSPDSIRFDQAPLPGGATAIFRFLFSTVPQWVQIGGAIAAVLVGLALAVIAWRRRADLRTWLVTRSRGTKIALASTVFVGMMTVVVTGALSWNFMMHENDFCSSCHVMKSAFNRFQVSEHDKLECHSCHRQSIFASSMELYYWVVNRPEKIPAHAPVPNRICQECHEQPTADSTWKRVIATAGHQVHFRSDSLKARGLLCLDCHAREVHAFKAVDVGCQQSGCHDQVKVRLGRMANQSGMHCITCHDFGRSLDEHIAMDSSRQALVPARQECFSCHEMSQKLAARGLDKDPHKATCGTCHNAHDQTQAANAFKSCATSGCHANADTLTAFHRGLGTHRLDQCGSCHKPHSWKVESTQCLACHRDIYKDRVRAGRASTEAALSGALPDEASPRYRGGPHEPVDDGASPDWSGANLTFAHADTLAFQHGRHRSLACTTCHDASKQHGRVTVRSRAECQSCHHAPDARAGPCTACHVSAELPVTSPVTTTLRISGRGTPLQRSLAFPHDRHQRSACTTCHAPGSPESVRITCAECHADHHRATATCSTCHEDARATHTRDAHLGCARCHATAGIDRLPESRTMCLTCHRAQSEHKPGLECANCHRTGWGTGAGAA